MNFPFINMPVNKPAPAGSYLLRGFARLLGGLSLLIILSSAGLLVNPGPAAGQVPDESLQTRLEDDMLAGRPELFVGDGRIRLLVLGLRPNGLTESAAEQIGHILEKDLNNTAHFDVVGPREINSYFERMNPDLVDCREIACGVESGNILGAQRALVGSLRLDNQTFILQIRLIDPANNLTDYEEELRFNDANMEERLFRLANRISDNSLLEGQVINTSHRGVVISLGKVHGIKLGNHLVIYKKDVPITNQEGRQLYTQRKKVAIVKVLNVNENSSEAIIIHKIEAPYVGEYAQTYLDNIRQIELIENTRRELDTGIRLGNQFQEVIPESVVREDEEKIDWEQRMIQARMDKDMWMIVMAGGGGLAGYMLLSGFSTEMSYLLQLGIAGGAAGYGFWQWDQSRKKINDLSVEGRAKGYITDLRLQPVITRGYKGLAMSFKY
ncbi:MAG: hypothetical protein OEZ59_12195 [Deltaproteobacteria bacterium]|nr:hypothetical protein [Deltaproteobacteria bacterium]